MNMEEVVFGIASDCVWVFGIYNWVNRVGGGLVSDRSHSGLHTDDESDLNSLIIYSFSFGLRKHYFVFLSLINNIVN